MDDFRSQEFQLIHIITEYLFVTDKKKSIKFAAE